MKQASFADTTRRAFSLVFFVERMSLLDVAVVVAVVVAAVVEKGSLKRFSTAADKTFQLSTFRSWVMSARVPTVERKAVICSSSEQSASDTCDESGVGKTRAALRGCWGRMVTLPASQSTDEEQSDKFSTDENGLCELVAF